ncbi:hypothetical protein B0O80DRAFT_490553 [Mortierella sp. GBAus27b]|nr:hypothetical protein B0O80DRAFT_490553 [Mortierella sp. GBAus27b]
MLASMRVCSKPERCLAGYNHSHEATADKSMLSAASVVVRLNDEGLSGHATLAVSKATYITCTSRQRLMTSVRRLHSLLHSFTPSHSRPFAPLHLHTFTSPLPVNISAVTHHAPSTIPLSELYRLYLPLKRIEADNGLMATLPWASRSAKRAVKEIVEVSDQRMETTRWPPHPSYDEIPSITYPEGQLHNRSWTLPTLTSINANRSKSRGCPCSVKKLERPHDVRQFVDHNKADGMTIATVAKREGPNVNDAGLTTVRTDQVRTQCILEILTNVFIIRKAFPSMARDVTVYTTGAIARLNPNF